MSNQLPTEMIAGSIGFTWTYNPLAGQTNNITSLTGLTVKMKVVNASQAYEALFTCTVSGDGTTAAYTTQSAGDFPEPGNYELQWIVSNTAGTVLIRSPIYNTQVLPIL